MPTDGSWTTRTDFECRVPLPNDLFPSVVHAAPLVSRDRMIENTVVKPFPARATFSSMTSSSHSMDALPDPPDD